MASRISERIRARQIEHLYQHLPYSLFAAVFITLGLLYFLRDFPNQRALLGWAVLMLIIQILRAGTIIFFTKHPPKNLQEWLRAEYRFLAGIIFSGIAWGLLGAWLYPMTSDMDTHQLILIILVGLAGGGSISFSFRRLPVTMFVLLVLSPLFYGLYKSSGSQNLAIALALLFYIVFLLRSAFTFQRNHEQLLILKESSLERERKLRRSQRAAEEASRAKSNFLANMSHEIRTPLNVIIGMSRLIMETELDAKQKKYLGRIESSATILMGQLNGILDFSKIEAGQLILEKQPFLMETLLDGIYSTMIGLAREKGLELRIEGKNRVPEACIGDPVRISQILINLVGNAVKFTEKGEVHIGVRPEGDIDAEGRLTLRFTVRDTGIGIPAGKQKLLFESFQQADSSISRKYGGTGLGLAISRQLVELMGGTISVTSREGRGSTFTFTVVVEPCDPEAVKQVHTVDPGDHDDDLALRILLVEDNEANRELATIVLESAGQAVIPAADGLDALARLGEQGFDLILMDVQMPRMNGITATRMIRAIERKEPVPPTIEQELLARLRARLAGGHIPIIAMTAHAMDSDRKRCLDAGMDDYLTKPFQPEQVLEVLARFGPGPADQAGGMKRAGSTQAARSEEADDDMGARVQAHLRATYGLQEAQIEQLLATTAASLREQLERAGQACRDQDSTTLREAAHAAKGNLLNLGLPELGELASGLEKQAEAGETRSCKEKLARLRDRLAGLLR